MSRLIIFDFNNLMFRGLNALPDLSFAGISTAGLYGFILQFTKHLSDFEPDYALMCSDSPPYERTKIFHGYKELRKSEADKDPEKRKIVSDGYRLCKEFLDVIQLPIWTEPGYEADDLIAIACEELHPNFRKIRIVSNDEDLLQLLRYRNVEIKRGPSLITRKTFELLYPGVDPKDWYKAVAIIGGHNDIPGIPKYGKKKALGLLREPARYEKFYEENYMKLSLYLKLTKLPWKDNKDEIRVPSLKKAVYQERKMIRFLSYYGIDLTSPFRKGLEYISSFEE
jgi:DNA polymerase-1